MAGPQGLPRGRQRTLLWSPPPPPPTRGHARARACARLDGHRDLQRLEGVVVLDLRHRADLGALRGRRVGPERHVKDVWGTVNSGAMLPRVLVHGGARPWKRASAPSPKFLARRAPLPRCQPRAGSDPAPRRRGVQPPLHGSRRALPAAMRRSSRRSPSLTIPCLIEVCLCRLGAQQERHSQGERRRQPFRCQSRRAL